MLNKFKELIDTYGSKEVSMSDLQMIQMNHFVSFENRGISRSNTNCLLCVIIFNRLSKFKNALLSSQFVSYEQYEQFIMASGFDLKKDHESTETYVSHKSEDGFFEISCSIEKNGQIHIDSEDINLQEAFNVYLRIQ